MKIQNRYVPCLGMVQPHRQYQASGCAEQHKQKLACKRHTDISRKTNKFDFLLLFRNIFFLETICNRDLNVEFFSHEIHFYWDVGVGI